MLLLTSASFTNLKILQKLALKLILCADHYSSLLPDNLIKG
jgi:hypothetical protein